MIIFNDMVFNDLYVKNKTISEKATISVNLKELILKEMSGDDKLVLGVDNVELNFDAHNDSLLVDLSWDDNSKIQIKKVTIDYNVF